MTKKIKRMVSMTCTSLLLFTNYCFAGVADSNIAKGTTNLLNDISSWLLIIAPIVTVVFIGYYLLRKSTSDEMDAKRWDSRIKVAIFCCIGVVVASGLITTITNYYK